MKLKLNENNKFLLQYFVEYLDEEKLFEASLSRVWKHEKKGFVMMSAFRGFDMKKNLKSHNKLKKELKKLKLGFFEVDGVYRYDDGHTENELSVFIPYRDIYTIEEFKDIANKLRKKFNQESVLFKYPDDQGGDAVLIYSSREEKIGSNVGYDKISFAYSKLRSGSHQGRSFVIEGVCEPINHISAMGFKSQGILY